MAKIPIGLQMYTVRDVCETDFIGALRQVADIGYSNIELAGTYGLSASELRDVLDELGLKCVGHHMGERDLDKLVEFNKTIGCAHVGGPSLPPGDFPNDEASCLAAAKHMNEVGAAYKERGLHLYYHNHAHEFKQVNGKYILDIFYENTHPELVYAQIDVYWVQYAGVDPASYLRKYPGRCPLVHIKDMDEDRGFAEIGEGILDWDDIFAACEEVNAGWCIVEQDRCNRPSMESARLSFENLKARGMV
jgi:sugar phosphate isomerase/epimerase